MMDKPSLLARAVELRDAGRLFRRGDAELEDIFQGSIDRFCDIALALEPAHRVLDVGAGHGLLLSFLTELGHECHALDVVDQPAAHPEIYGKGITFHLCNVEADPIPYPDESFDAVVCCQVLEHFTHFPRHRPLAAHESTSTPINRLSASVQMGSVKPMPIALHRPTVWAVSCTEAVSLICRQRR